MTRLMAFAAPVVVGMMFECSCAGSAQVTMGQVQNFLVIGIGMDCSHEPTHDLIFIITTLTAGASPFVVQEAFEIT